MDFCRIPRSSKDIYSFLGMTSRGYATSAYIVPLVESGQLIQTIPIKSSKPKFVTAEYAKGIPTADAILDFCKVPRKKSEIAQHFGLKYFVARKLYDPLIKSGKLLGDMPNTPNSSWQKFVAADTAFPITKEERILEFCKTPKSRKEIAAHLGMNFNYIVRYAKLLAESGKLKMTKPEMPSSIDQRFYSADIEVIVLSETTMLAFCKMPQSRRDIAEHFNIKRYLAEKYINDYVREGKLKMTMPINPDCKQQRFVDSQVEVNIFSEETLLEFCKAPRSKEEISQYFGTTTKGAVSTFINPLLNNGKLKRTFPEYPKHKYQRFYSSF